VTRQEPVTQGGRLRRPALAPQLNAIVRPPKPENAVRLADSTKNYYDALIKRGITKDQALQIVMAVGIPHAGSTGR